MKKYLLKRILFSLFSLIVVTGVVIILIYNLIDRNGILVNDPNYSKVSMNEQIVYKYQRFQEYGYIDYQNMYETPEYINLSAEEKAAITDVTKDPNNTTLDSVISKSSYCRVYAAKMQEQGYKVEFLARRVNKRGRAETTLTSEYLVCTRERNVLERIGNLFANMFKFETIWDVQDEALTERYIRLEWDNRSNMPAIVGSGTTHKYLLYFDSSFPFVHQNFFHLRLGKSFVLQKNSDVVEYMQLKTGDRATEYQIAPKDINNEETYNKYSTFAFVAKEEAKSSSSKTEAALAQPLFAASDDYYTRKVNVGEWGKDNASIFIRCYGLGSALLTDIKVDSDTVTFPENTVSVQLFRMPAGSEKIDEETCLRTTALINLSDGDLTFISWDKRILTGLDFHTVTYRSGQTSTSDLVYYSADEHYANAADNNTGLSRIGMSFVIGIIATFISYIIGIPVGIWMAQRKDKLVDKIGNFYIIFFMAVPSLAYIFMLASFGISVFSLPYKFALADVRILAFIMPIASLAVRSIGGLMKWMRRYMVDQQNSDYVKFARSQGLSEGEIFSKHISRNAFIYLVHGIPAEILTALTGVIITERVYGVPGIGNMLTEAINKYDNPVIVGTTIFYTALTIVSLILGDVLLAKYDPRISLSNEKN